ncbi:MAG TPA: hypothetical protein VFX97_16785 [Pyrinomonadaceae bacterium]|nr:hypothetical protein [Pyrinomonadaceae bacterium]
MRCSLCPRKIDPTKDDFEETASCEFAHSECVEEKEEKERGEVEVDT